MVSFRISVGKDEKKHKKKEKEKAKDHAQGTVQVTKETSKLETNKKTKNVEQSWRDDPGEVTKKEKEKQHGKPKDKHCKQTQLPNSNMATVQGHELQSCSTSTLSWAKDRDTSRSLKW